uniref:C2H2-type domain-containing protein n=1 Tax=Echinostoma caproni TaxID=27848 RepID=A0A183AIA9_9TREM
LSQLDTNKTEPEPSGVSQENDSTNQPVEIIDLMLPSGASTPAYSSLWDPGSDKIERQTSLPVSCASSLPRLIQPCSPLCLSQLARETEDEECAAKRRRLDETNAYKSGSESTGTTQLQTPNFKPSATHQIMSTEVPRQDFFSTEDRLKMYESCVRLGTTSIAPCLASEPSQPAAQPSYLGVVPFTESSSTPWIDRTTALYLPPISTPSSQQPVNNLVWSSNSYDTCYSSSHPSTVARIETVEQAHGQMSVLDSNTNYSIPRSTGALDASAEQALPTAFSWRMRFPSKPVTYLETQPGVGASSPGSIPTHSESVWSKPLVVLGDSMRDLPLVRNSGPSSMATLILYQSTIPVTGTTTTLTTTPSMVGLKTPQPIQFSSSPSVVQGPVNSLGKSVVFSMAQVSGLTWATSSGSTVLVPVNVDLDSPNPRGLSSVQATVAPSIPGLSATPCLSTLNSVPSTTMLPNVSFGHNVSQSSPSVASLPDKENLPPSSTARTPIIPAKPSRRKVGLIGSTYGPASPR